MKIVKAFVKKYWVTALIFAGLIALYVFSTESGRANPFLFPKVTSIRDAFLSDKHLMGVNLWASFKMMIPAVLISLAIALALGTFLGLNKKARRDAVHECLASTNCYIACL